MPPLTLPSAVDLARAQFALTVVWHVLFPTFTIRPLASPG
ncbi:cytochrome d ubiquinol oxidase subunit I [Methylobacterium brachiatum]|jgi:cytochrome bd ubiquinol oxidase subunit I|uniref:Cytochrome d ubiquinol oxidase subunit I n=1 Tax=Methylobacterium brachiatum TaxID=269660 RepID=A0AAJ1TML0_9HYPH|nr:cytochrome ubiquinol oxidase subunit I [Methylobacterium brachiatum]MCB4800806.1 cytochrome ubiquinol oxidase subunit I [Methylobacterium brachiatum]MDQ0541429.1 cytochrome d ubiquinol oxidase subunit I [Methylobacterium brachiatum]